MPSCHASPSSHCPQMKIWSERTVVCICRLYTTKTKKLRFSNPGNWKIFYCVIFTHLHLTTSCVQVFFHPLKTLMGFLPWDMCGVELSVIARRHKGRRWGSGDMIGVDEKYNSGEDLATCQSWSPGQGGTIIICQRLLSQWSTLSWSESAVCVSSTSSFTDRYW